MDKGFLSAKNVNGLLADETYHFIIAVPFTSNFAKSHVTSESKDIDCLENTILVGPDSIRAVTKVGSWNKDHKVWTHVHFYALKATETREDLYAHVAWL